MPTALNVDGLERKRRKWNAAARAWYARIRAPLNAAP